MFSPVPLSLSTIIVAPGKGKPLESRTLPFKLDWEKVKLTQNSANNKK